MTTVDCSKAQSIRDKLLVYVADRLGMMPILKGDKFILTSLDDSHTVETSAVLAEVTGFIESNKLQENIKVISKEENIIVIIESFNDAKLKEDEKRKKELFFECTHCGFMTQYEIELRTHKLIHYI